MHHKILTYPGVAYLPWSRSLAGISPSQPAALTYPGVAANPQACPAVG
jgi:hypothetical protein